MTLEPHVVNSNELWTLGIAAYAAIISTFVLGCDAYKWLAAGPKIELRASTGMMLDGGPVKDTNIYISITAHNVGDQPTTITNLCGTYYETWWNAYIRNKIPAKAFVVNEPSKAQPIPYRFDVGVQWQGLMIQTDDIVTKARDDYLFLILYTARGGRGTQVRVRWRDKDVLATNAESQEGTNV